MIEEKLNILDIIMDLINIGIEKYLSVQ